MVKENLWRKWLLSKDLKEMRETRAILLKGRTFQQEVIWCIQRLRTFSKLILGKGEIRGWNESGHTSSNHHRA